MAARKKDLFPIEWHENCLRNVEVHLADKEKQLVSLQSDIKRLENTIADMKRRIRIAKSRKVAAFSPDVDPNKIR